MSTVRKVGLSAAACLSILLCGSHICAAETLSGTVTVRGGGPAADAFVTIHANGYFATQRTDPTGRFAFSVGSNRAKYTIRVRLQGYATATRTMRGSGSLSPIELVPLAGALNRTCASPCPLRGVVKDEHDASISGATVLLKTFLPGGQLLRTVSAGDGTFSFADAGNFTVNIIASHARYVADGPVSVEPRLQQRVTIRLRSVQPETDVSRSLEGVIAVGVRRSHADPSVDTTDVFLATPSGRHAWRSRILETPWFEGSALTTTGTKLVLSRLHEDRSGNQVQMLAVDLTTPLTKVDFGLDPTQVTTQVTVTGATEVNLVQRPSGLNATRLNAHDLDEYVVLKSARGLQIVKDTATHAAPNDVGPCAGARSPVRTAATDSSHSTLCVGEDGTLSLALSQFPLFPLVDVPGRVAPDSVIVADGGDPSLPTIASFIEVRFTPDHVELWSVMDGTQLGTLAVSADDPTRVYLGVLAALALQSRTAPRLLTVEESRHALTGLSAAADARSNTDWFWSFSRTRIDERLYAPVLELERDELAVPSRIEVWNTRRLQPELPRLSSPLRYEPGSEAAARETYLIHQFDSERRQNPVGRDDERCRIYFKVVDLQRTWLIQYWFYYPFDIGGLGSHLHDSEHLFVEVDKLGGQVVNIIGAAHGGLTANNVFRAAATPTPVSLPLFAVVELGKHATAPDLNHDGVFTPGIDDNAHHSTAQLWGIRDTMGNTDSRLAPYGAHMASVHTERLAIGPTATIYKQAVDALNFAAGCQCDLWPFPEFSDPVVKADCTEGTLAREVSAPGEDCAREFLNEEPDRLDINNMWKKWNFPFVFVRVGTHTKSTATNGQGVDADFVLGLERPSRDFLHGRLALGASARTSVDEFRVQYEGFFTNLWGAFGGWQYDRNTAGARQGHWAVGPLAEFPIPKLNRPGYAALAVGLQSGAGLSLQWRFAVDVWARQRYRYVGSSK